jgi:hypothetical protein
MLGRKGLAAGEEEEETALPRPFLLPAQGVYLKWRSLSTF